MYGHTFFGQSGWFFMVNQKIIMYRLVMRNHEFIAFYFLKLYHIFGRKIGAEGSGDSRPAHKVGHWVELLGQPLSQKTVLGTKPPPLKFYSEIFLNLTLLLFSSDSRPTQPFGPQSFLPDPGWGSRWQTVGNGSPSRHHPRLLYVPHVQRKEISPSHGL